MILFFLGFMALLVVVGVRVGLRAVRYNFRSINAQIDVEESGR